MCRNIKMLFNFDPPVTDDEIRAASLQYVRKISGFTKPSQVNKSAFDEAVAAAKAGASSFQPRGLRPVAAKPPIGLMLNRRSTAAGAVPRLLTLTQAAAVALADPERVLAWDGAGADHHA